MPEAPGEATAPASLGSRVRGLILRPAIRQRVLGPMGFDASILVMNLLTGIIVARALGPSGRGELAAIMMIAQTAGWLLSVGATEAVSYRLAKNPDDGGRLMGTWLAASVPLAAIAFLVGQLLLPILFAAQTPEAIDIARVYMLIVGLVIVQSILNGMLLGDHDFLAFNVVRLVPPAIGAVGYLALWATGHLSVELALAVAAVASTAGCLVAGVHAQRRHGVERPSFPMLRETFSYGIRAHGGSISSLVNARLDLLIIPAFLTAASVGLYSVATNVTSIITTLTTTIALIVLPVAARRKDSARTVVRTLHAVLLIGLTIAIPLGVLAQFALELVYGADFGAAATCVRILLPGVVLNAASIVLWSGLLAANRPFLSTVSTAPAAVVTVVGLILFLDRGGIEAAAIVSTTAYTTVFVLSVFLYRHITKLRWRDFLIAPAG